MGQPSPTYSIVVPVYQNASSIDALVNRLEDLAAFYQGDFEAVLVVDGSPDDSASLLRARLPTSPLRARLIVLSRNFGSFAAIATGLAASRGHFCCVMAADLQEPMQFVLDAFAALSAGRADIAIGQRVGRSDPIAQTFASRAFWGPYRSLVNSEIPEGGVDVFACTRRVATQITSFTESNTSLIGLLFWVGFRREMVPYEREPRHSGASSWGLRKRTRYLLDSVYAFTDAPIILLQLIGAIGFVLSLLIGVLVLVGWTIGVIVEPGYTPLMLAIAAGTSAILLGLGIVGSYTWRAYENSKARPQTITASEETYE